MQFVDECKKCGEFLKVDELLQKKEFVKDGKSIYLIYFDCPKCDERCFVQIDDDTSLAMLDSVKRTFVKFARRKRQGKSISKKENSKFAEARANLSVYRTNLMKEYTGKVIYDEYNGAEYTLRFFI